MRKAIFRLVQWGLLTSGALTAGALTAGGALTTGAYAQSRTSVVEDFGLLGTWAVECSRPPSPTNEHSLFSLTNAGTVWVFNDFGPDYDGMVYRVADAKLVDSDKLSLRQILANDDAIVLDIVMLKTNDRIRVWSSRTDKGDTLVKDGAIASSTEQQTRWAARCGERRASVE